MIYNKRPLFFYFIFFGELKNKKIKKKESCQSEASDIIVGKYKFQLSYQYPNLAQNFEERT